MAEGVINTLEIVQVQEQQRPIRAVSSRLRKPFLKCIEKPAAVKEAGKGIVVRHTRQLFYEMLTFRDILLDCQEMGIFPCAVFMGIIEVFSQ